MTAQLPVVPRAERMRGVDELPAPIPFGGLRSRCRVTACDAAHRVDPWYHNLWLGGAQTSWLTVNALRRMERDGVANRSRQEQGLTPASARERMWTHRRTLRLSTVAAVQMWRTLTAQQLAAITGSPTPTRDDFMAPAFHAALVERGTFVSELGSQPPGRANRLYRPGNVEAFDVYAAGLDYPELVGVTAGRDWTRGAQFDRHNILAAELALRVAEYCDVATVLGEQLAHLDALSTDRRGTHPSCADAVLVRADGHRIAVELTASFGDNTIRKIDKWARILATTDTHRVGLSVVFVEAANPDRPRGTIADIYRSMRSAVGRAALGTPDAVRCGVPQRMAVARWPEWFPAARSCSTEFLSLAAWRPTGPHAQRWRPVNLLDPFDLEFDPADPDAGQPLIRNSRHLLGVPKWMRDPTPAGQFTSALLAQAGLDQPLDPPARADVRAHRRQALSAAADATDAMACSAR